MSDVPAIEVEALRDMMAKPNKPFVLDVREKWEKDICSLPDSVLIPLATLPKAYENLPKDRPLVVHCHHGGRSAKAVAFLQGQGFGNAVNLKGGIHAWSQRIDGNVKTYE